MKIHELLADPRHWCQGYDAEDRDYVPVEPTDPEACSWCLNGALIKCYPNPPERKRIRDKINRELRKLGIPASSLPRIIVFNDIYATYQASMYEGGFVFQTPHAIVLNFVKELDV